MIDTSLITTLRAKTGAGIVDCKQALEEAGGNIEKAEEILRKKGLKTAEKKAGRTAKEGLIVSYIHGDGKIGVLVELNCETDFVARSKDFQDFAKDLAMHIAASAPDYVRVDDVPAAVIEKEKEIMQAQLKQEGKPEQVWEKIIEGKMKKFFSEQCLLQQEFIKDEEKTIQDLLHALIAKVGENISIRRFTRYVLGEE